MYPYAFISSLRFLHSEIYMKVSTKCQKCSVFYGVLDLRNGVQNGVQSIALATALSDFGGVGAMLGPWSTSWAYSTCRDILDLPCVPSFSYLVYRVSFIARQISKPSADCTGIFVRFFVFSCVFIYSDLSMILLAFRTLFSFPFFVW